jgi:hypothetical protein
VSMLSISLQSTKEKGWNVYCNLTAKIQL